MKKLIIAGGTGFLGTAVAKYFSSRVDSIVILGRNTKTDFQNVKYVNWNTETIEPWWSELNGADAVINLAGKNVNCRYTDRNKKEIFASRLDTTQLLGEAIQKCPQPPAVWLNASSATIYRDSRTKLMTEADGEVGDDFSMSVCRQWEETFVNANATNTRKIILRTSIVLGAGGGAFEPLAKLTRMGMGGTQGDGMQQCSWIHEEDFCRIVDWLIFTKSAKGVYNVTAPNPVANRDFMTALREALNISIGIPVGRALLTIGAAVIGTETELVLKSRYVYPERLLQAGFVFKYPTIRQAFADLAKSFQR